MPLGKFLRCGWRAESGVQLVEFAVVLPLLVVFVYGIFDFSNAFSLKQKLTGAVRDGARFGADLPSGDTLVQTSGGGGSIAAANLIMQAVDASLIAARVDDCGLGSTTNIPLTGPLIWEYDASGGACNSTNQLILTVNRGFLYKASINANQVDVLATQVTISYPYPWRFNRVITLLSPGASYSGVVTISSTSTMVNAD